MQMELRWPPAAHLLLCGWVPNWVPACGPGVGDPCPRERDLGKKRILVKPETGTF